VTWQVLWLPSLYWHYVRQMEPGQVTDVGASCDPHRAWLGPRWMGPQRNPHDATWEAHFGQNARSMFGWGRMGTLGTHRPTMGRT
jgi:hypothetical protein